MTWHYRYAGLSFASDLHLPEWTAFETSEVFADPEVAIIVRAACDPGSLEPRITPDEYRFVARDAGEYQVRGGREIVVTPLPAAGAAEIRLFLQGSALAAIAYQRGLLWLHTSVVETAAGAIAFAGHAGSGKSTLAAWLCRSGRRLIADDLARFERGPGGIWAHPAARRVKLWRDVMSPLGLSDAAFVRDHRRADKFHVPCEPGPVPPPTAVRVVFLLGWGPATVERLSGLDALRELVATATYRIDLLAPMQQSAPHWQRCAELAGAVPVVRLTRPKEPSRLRESLTLVEAQIDRHLDTLMVERSGW